MTNVFAAQHDKLSDVSQPGTTASDFALRLDQATVAVGGRTIWSDADLAIEQGQFTAVLGPNGAGKSSMLKVTLGLLPLTTGTVTVLGSAAGESNQRIGYLPQRRTFDPSLRIRGVDVVRFGLDGHRWGMPLPGARNRETRRRVDEAIELVGAGAYADRPVGQTSGGEQQRLLIAQALVRRPDMLLLDEPLDSLDLPNQHAISGLVLDICRNRGITVLMVAHDVNPIVAFLDHVVYVSRGQIMAGSPAEVITSETLTSLYETPVEVLRTRDGRPVVVGAPDGHTHHAHR